MRLTGDHNQCPTCREYFNSSAAFDKHRYGDFSIGRFCLPEWEMWCRGMRRNASGFWVTKENPFFAKAA